MPFKGSSKKDTNKENHESVCVSSSHSSHGGGGHDESNWLVSYADMMTLLCGFFIMLFSMAKMDMPKYDSFKEAIAKQFGGEVQTAKKDMEKLAKQIEKDLGKNSPAHIKHDASGVSIVFESTVFFSTLSADVSLEGQTIIKKLLTSISNSQKTNSKQYNIVVEGHTDSRPIFGGSFASNWELSGARAARVVRMFLDSGFSAKHLTAIGYADTHPKIEPKTLEDQKDERLLGKNRRVVLRILGPYSESIPFPEPPENAQPVRPLTSAGAPGTTPMVNTAINPRAVTAKPNFVPGALGTSGRAPAQAQPPVQAPTHIAPGITSQTAPKKPTPPPQPKAANTAH